MQTLLSIFTFFYLVTGCQSSGSQKAAINDSLARQVLDRYAETIHKDTIKPAKPPKPYDELKYEKKEVLSAASGTKSVIFNSTGSKLYAMNLEGMSVYEFDQHSKKITREFKFKPTRGTGWDYNKSKPIASFQEKPVEACLSHDDEILWVSLHNAEGIVPIWLNDFSKNKKSNESDQKTKPVTVIYPGSSQKDSFYVPLIDFVAKEGNARIHGQSGTH